jgi:hypothetical protein
MLLTCILEDLCSNFGRDMIILTDVFGVLPQSLQVNSVIVSTS